MHTEPGLFDGWLSTYRCQLRGIRRVGAIGKGDGYVIAGLLFEALGLARRVHDEVRARVPEVEPLPEPVPAGPPTLL